MCYSSRISSNAMELYCSLTLDKVKATAIFLRITNNKRWMSIRGINLTIQPFSQIYKSSKASTAHRMAHLVLQNSSTK